jgi:predicted small lipoprotein YifL
MSVLSRSLIVFVSVSLAACGSLGHLEGKTSAKKAEIRDYGRVVVVDFTANDTRPAKDDKEKTERAAEIEQGRIAFADKIAEEITASKAFSEVSRTPATGKALKVGGSIDLWEPGNVAARALTGFAGKSEFNATVIVTDAGTGEELARLKVDRNSWPLPIGASTTIVQTVDFFKNQAAKRVADELAKAKGVAREAAEKK